MTIKGPYIVSETLTTGQTPTDQNTIRRIYNAKSRRQYLSDTATTYKVVWFTDKDYNTHHSFTIQIETTYYRRGKADSPYAQTITQECEYRGDANEPPNFSYLSYRNIGKTMWWFAFHGLEITDVIGDNGDKVTYEIPSLAIYKDGSRIEDGISTAPLSCTYSDVGFDFVSMKVSVVPSGQNAEFAATDTLSIEARPAWYIAAARYLDLYTLEIDVTSDFARTDDRWALEGTSYVVNNELSLLRDEEPWGMIEGVRDKSGDAENNTGGAYTHVIYVDTTYFARVLGGRLCVFNMHFNHIWNDANESTVSASNQVTVETDNKCITPRIEGTVDDTQVTINLLPGTQSDDDSVVAQYAIVALDGAKFKDDIQLVTLEDGKGKAVFPYPPLDKYITFEAVGLAEVDGVYHASAVATYSLAIESHGNILLDSVMSGNRCMIKFHSSGSDMGPSISVKNDAVTEQLAGRRRPSVFYGESGTTDISFDGLLVDDEGDDFEDIPESGLCILRFPGGRRYAADVSVSISDSGNRLTSVSVSGSEVDY